MDLVSEPGALRGNAEVVVGRFRVVAGQAFEGGFPICLHIDRRMPQQESVDEALKGGERRIGLGCGKLGHFSHVGWSTHRPVGGREQGAGWTKGGREKTGQK